MRLSDLHPWARNPRSISPEAFRGLGVSLDEFGDLSGVTFNERTGRLVTGHQRVKALTKKHGDLDVVDGFIVTPDGERFRVRIVDWDESKEKAANVAANSPLIAGEFTDALPEILDEIRDELPDIVEDLRFEELRDEFTEEPGKSAPPPHAPIIKQAKMEDLVPTEEELAQLRGRKLLVQFSGGKDSSGAVLWCRHFLPEAETELVFVDLGADHVGFNAHLHDFARAVECPLIVERSTENIIDAMLRRGGWPRFMHPWCHDLLVGTFSAHVRKYDPQSIVVVRGGRLQEKAARHASLPTRFRTVDAMKGYVFFEPLYFADKASEFLTGSGAPIWSGYARGLGRTACRVCPGQKQGTYAAIRRALPDVWAELLDLERRFGPGCWRDPIGNAGQGRFVDLADRGDARLPDGDDLDPGGDERLAGDAPESA